MKSIKSPEDKSPTCAVGLSWHVLFSEFIAAIRGKDRRDRNSYYSSLKGYPSDHRSSGAFFASNLSLSPSPPSQFFGARIQSETKLLAPRSVEHVICGATYVRWVLSITLLTTRLSYHEMPLMSKMSKLKNSFIKMVFLGFGLVCPPPPRRREIFQMGNSFIENVSVHQI